MSDNTPTTTGNDLAANVGSTGTAPRNDYAITPDLRPYADSVLAMDPIRDVPPPYEFPEGHSWPAPRSTSLPDPQRQEVQAKLATLPPEQREARDAEFTAAAIRSMSAAIRVKTGVGQGATPFHREMVGIAREVYDLDAEFNRLQSALETVVRYDASVDPATGEASATPVYAVTDTRAEAYVAQQKDILRQIRLLVNDEGYGLEGRRRMDTALHESAMARKQLHEQMEDHAEAKVRAVHNERERRINERAESLARLTRNGR